MLRVFTELLPGVPKVPLLYPNLGSEQRDSILFLNNAFADLREPIIELTQKPEDADFLLLAHNYPSLKKYPDFVEKQANLAKEVGKQLIVFWHGDSDAPVEIENALVFRTSLYRYTKREHEMAMPAYAEDLLQGGALTLRQKGERPIVGFCGWARYKNTKNIIGTLLQNSLLHVAARIGHPAMFAHRKGLSFRREAIAVLNRDDRISKNFILRSSYSGNKKTIRTDPEEARSQYRSNLLQSDLALCIKGDGNYSYRFYEALSLGRVPLLIDTECVLPFEDRIDYDSFILRVNYKRLNDLPAIIDAWWKNISPEEFVAMQKKAREAFERYLSVKSFLKEALEALEATRSY